MLEEPKFIKRFRIIIVPGTKYSICEIWYQNEKWAEINQDTQLMVQFFSLEKFPLEITIEVLEKAKKIFLST